MGWQFVHGTLVLLSNLLVKHGWTWLSGHLAFKFENRRLDGIELRVGQSSRTHGCIDEARVPRLARFTELKSALGLLSNNVDLFMTEAGLTHRDSLVLFAWHLVTEG